MESPNVSQISSETSSLSEEPVVKNPKMDNHSVAKFLIRNKFLLTALEYHMEMMERGYENPCLRDYFSNPGNFEGIREDTVSSRPLARTASITTFDSLDFTRMSDDGNQSENRIQTLEYQLRAANEKIQKLQNELTYISEEKKFSAVSESLGFVGDSQVPPIILSKVDGDDQMGLSGRARNISTSGGSMGGGTVADPLSIGGPILPHEKRALNYLVNEYLLQHNYRITSNTFGDENEGEDLESWDEVGLHIAQPPSLLPLLRDFGSRMTCAPLTCSAECQVELISEHEIAELQEENSSVKRSLELADVRSEDLLRRLEETQSELSIARENVVRLEKNLIERKLIGSEDRGSIADETLASSDGDLNGSAIGCEGRGSPEGSSENSRKVFPSFIAELQVNLVPSDSSIIVSSEPDSLLRVLGNHLPKLVETAESDITRECLLPVLVHTACLHPDQSSRDRLLHVLFNLSSRPNLSQRQLILQGCRSLSRYLGPRRVEVELLPQLWEQIGHPEVTRRRLVAEACSALMEFIPSLLRSSLLFSMLMQMLEDRDSEVRVAVVRAFALLTATLADADKLNKIQELLFSNSCLYDDVCAAVADSSRRFLLPAVAQWCLETDCLHTQLLDNILARLEQPFVHCWLPISCRLSSRLYSSSRMVFRRSTAAFSLDTPQQPLPQTLTGLGGRCRVFDGCRWNWLQSLPTCFVDFPSRRAKGRVWPWSGCVNSSSWLAAYWDQPLLNVASRQLFGGNYLNKQSAKENSELTPWGQTCCPDYASVFCLCQKRSVTGRAEIIPDLLSRLTSARDPTSRASAGQLFHSALVSGQLQGQEILSNQVLPRLNELANDRDILVRGACYRALAQAVVLVWSGGCGGEAEEQASFMFRQMVSDCEASWSELSVSESQQHYQHRELLTAFAETAQNLPYQLRDQVVLPHLLSCVERRPCSSFNATRREETAQALQNCFTTLLHMSGLTTSGIQDYILPAIERLKSDLTTVGSDRQHTLALIISDYQLLLTDQENKFDNNSNATDAQQGSVKSRMLNKLRDFRESTSKSQPQPRPPSPTRTGGHFASLFQRKK